MIYAIAIGAGVLLFAIGALITTWRIDYARERAPFAKGPRHAATPPPRPQSPPTVAHLLPPPPAHSPDWKGTAYLPAPVVIAEGWRELPEPQGPFPVEWEEPPAAFFDAYDLAVIGMYEPEPAAAPPITGPRPASPAWPDALVADAGGHHSVDEMLDSIVGRVDGLMVALAAVEERHG